MKKVFLSALAAILAAGLIFTGCTQPAPAPSQPAPPMSAPPKTLDIGLATPLTGVVAWLGINVQNAALLAIDDQNEQGGVTIAGQKYMLNAIIRDTKHDLTLGKSVAEELIFDKGIKIIAAPFQFDALGVQSATEPNKVIMLGSSVGMPGQCSSAKPYSFFCAGGSQVLAITGAPYIHEFYPEAKNVVCMIPDLPVIAEWVEATKIVSERYGLNWLSYEKFPFDTKDFMPVISRALAKNPDIIETSLTGGAMGAMGALLIKQLREAGFDGIIWCPTVPPPPVMMEVVPEKYLTRIITHDIVVDSPIVSQAYKDMYNRYVKKFGTPPIDIVGEFYNGIKAFFEFLNGQDTMDTTVWMNGFEKYRWQGVWGREAFWVGKPIYGINRTLLWSFWVAEYINGKAETRWQAPIPYELFVE